MSIPASALINPLTLLNSDALPAHLFPSFSPSSASGSRLSPSTSVKRARNGDTILPNEGQSRLTTPQLLNLFLAINRDPQRRGASDTGTGTGTENNWEAYFDTLPGTFRPWHPLCWLVKEPEPNIKTKAKTRATAKSRQQGDADFWEALVREIPDGARAKLDDVHGRYREDLRVLQGVIVSRVVCRHREKCRTSGRNYS